MKRIAAALAAMAWLSPCWLQAQAVVYEGGGGPGKGKHIVFVVGDQEYRSEESMPALARILAARQGFKCTVLLPINRQTGEIDPSVADNIPGLEALRSADLMVLFLRFQELPDRQMKEIIDYTDSGRPIVALRTSTHAFNYLKRLDSPYARYSYRSTEPAGGYGRLVLGETWINHYGVHEKESHRAIAAPGMEKHPLLGGVKDVWGESDVYEVTTLSGDSRPVMLGQVLSGMSPSSTLNLTKTKPMPVAWVKSYTGASGKPARIFTTTMGHALDFKSEGFRRLMVNACYWSLGMEAQIAPTTSVDFVRPYEPTPIGEQKFKRGVRTADLSP